MKNIRIIFLLLCLNAVLATSCSDYLDIVPDNIVTVDDAFNSRANAEKFRSTCYGYLPSIVRTFYDPSWIASRGDEFWYYNYDTRIFPYSNGDGGDIHGLRVFYGYQNADNPYLNYWDGGQAGIPLFRAIRECNIFLENIEEKNIVPDLNDIERLWWIGEVKFLKAYYHFYLMHLYGPIPIIRRNPDMNATPEELRVFREPIDEVVDYIVEVLDEAVGYLNHELVQSDKEVAENSYTYGGRITTSIAKALKAKVLVWAASPLFNGNNFYTDFKDSRGIQLIPAGDPDLNKWKRAADACLDAIQTAETLGGRRLYSRSPENGYVSSATELKYVLRYAVTDPFNSEIIWPSTHPTSGFSGWSAGTSNSWPMHTERESMPTFEALPNTAQSHSGSLGTTLKMAEQFYSKNGLPIEDDDEWQTLIGGFESRYYIKLAGGGVGEYHQYYIKQGRVTANLNFNREPRFYAYVGFDGGIWEGAGKSEDESYVVNKSSPTMVSNVSTGYYMKKIVQPESSFTRAGNSYDYVSKPYSFPYIRLSDLYLYYAEALTESVADGATPPNDAFIYVDKVRNRAGLKGVKETWDQPASNKHGLYNTKEGMRSIIRRERTIELCFEGKRGEDMRRWRIAHEQFNEPVRGWNSITPFSTVTNPTLLTDAIYYLVTDHHIRSVGYGMKDYLWPIKEDNINVNNNLKQNPGW
ncbi:MAG: RagB/SusD family nutrient uptake outer membrane protein [Prevotellaceae bacterium]|jgi:hypothetical protein|nr:RagB/SusD family nutrient uptake outer membrane protein [Prevotellaceae bacterium]